MADFERSATVGVGADTAFAYLADPQHLPEYVPGMTHVATTAVDGELEVEAEVQGRGGASEARFFADAAARRIEWGRPGSDYRGSFKVSQGTPSTCGLTIRLHVRDDADAVEIDRVLDETVRNLRRRLSRR